MEICFVIDFWGGFYYVELLMNELMIKVWKYFEEIEKFGGMIKVIEVGVFKMKIEEVVVCR